MEIPRNSAACGRQSRSGTFESFFLGEGSAGILVLLLLPTWAGTDFGSRLGRAAEK